MTKSVYLAGSMTGLTIEEAEKWRKYITARIGLHSNNQIDCFSPMRFKSDSWSGNINDTRVIDLKPDEDAILGSQRGLSMRDRHDCLSSDLLFINLMGTKQISKGTLIEVGMGAAQHHKPIVLLMEEENIHWHPMLIEYAEIWIKVDRYKFENLQENDDYYLDLSARIISSILCSETM